MGIAEDQLALFISYSHEDKPVALAIAGALNAAGARVWIDEGELRAGDSIIERIATAIAEVEFVVAVVSENSVQSRWCSKELSLALTEGLGREGVKLLPLRLGNVEMPATLADVYYLQVDPFDPAAVAERLLRDVRSHREGSEPEPEREPERRPQRGRARTSSAQGMRLPDIGVQSGDAWSGVTATGYGKEIQRRARRAGVTPADYARRGLAPGKSDRTPGSIADRGDVKLVGIVREGVGRPRNDGTRGSALYAVPFRLSRTPTSSWSRLLETTWDRPPEWSTMHRPGICSVHRDVVTLDGVTIEEVEQHHLKTLTLCVARVNEETDRQERARAAEVEREHQRIADHEASLDEAIERLDFD